MPSLSISRVRPVAISALLLLGLGACVGTSSPGWTFAPPPPTSSAAASASGSAGASASASASAGSSASASTGASASASAGASASGGGATVNLKAQNTAWVPTTLQAPADKAFQIAFDNEDAGTPHNLQINDANGQQVFMGDQVSGVATKTYDVPALKAGSYPFKCTIHPTMTGTLTVQ